MGDTGLDFELTFDNDGVLEFSYNKIDDYRNNLILSVELPLAKYSLNRSVGSKVAAQQGSKNIFETEKEIKQDLKDAEQWTIDAGRMTSIEITTEIVSPHRIDIEILGAQINGINVPYSTFVEVI